VNLVGDEQPELMVRNSDGVHAYTLDGQEVQAAFRPFRDAEGWSLNKHSATIRVAHTNGGTQSVILGRGRYGLEMYKYKDSWTQVADCPGSFPCWSDQGQLDAYQWISQHFENVDDIRSLYTQYQIKSGDWNNIQTNSKVLQYGGSKPVTPTEYVAVQSQLITEFGYVSTVRAWFDNNFDVLNETYGKSANLLAAARDNISAGNNDSVWSKWLEFAADIAGKISGALGLPQVMIAITIFEGTVSNLTQNAGGNVVTTVANITNELNTQWGNVDDQNASDQTAYMTDYNKLQQIGTVANSGGFDWAKATFNQIADAKKAAADGMSINFYRSLLPDKVRVIWSYGAQPPTDTPGRYDCIAGQDVQGTQFPATESYIATGFPPFSPPLNWNVADDLTGLKSAGQLDAIWYMMLLGANLGWDLQ
jgi:hypothetical protein